MKKRKFKIYVGDFETTVYKGQTFTEVWASAFVELYNDNVIIFQTLQEQFNHFLKLKCNAIVYYHNLKFDGAFWLSFLLKDLKLTQAYIKRSETDIEWLNEKDMPNNSFKYSISDRGQWYSIVIKTGNHIIEIRDSLKLLPFSVERIGKSFATAHKKLSMEYKGFRYAGCEITEEERKYISNDVLVIKEALEIMYDEGHSDLTIGSCCLKEFKSFYDEEDYDNFFPNLYDEYLEPKYTICDKGKITTVGDYIRRSYRGGWCYVVKGKEGIIYSNGVTADVNSLYPSMMSSESGNRFPVGKPKFWKGDFIPDEALQKDRYFFIRIKTRFYIKKDMLPFIQIKNNFMYRGTECLESSDIVDPETGIKTTKYYKDGALHDTRVELFLTMTDYYLLIDHYDLVDFEIIDGCIFRTQIGIFDSYIEKYKRIKANSEGAIRELAKLFLNNLYGKMASSTSSSFKVCFLKEDGTLGFTVISASGKTPGYIPIGSAITSYARNFTIRTAQKNYYGLDKPGFIYADTDSIHCNLSADELVGLNVHESDFCCWKLESYWDEAIFTRQKTYIEHITHEDGVRVEELKDKQGKPKPKKPYYNVKCAGMPSKCKDLFVIGMQGGDTPEWVDDDMKELVNEFLSKKYSLKDFAIGLSVPGKLRPKRIPGGILLVETTYKMR